MMLEQLDIHLQNIYMNLLPYPLPYTNINSKLAIDLNAKH